jgi:hypothetical protein
MAKIKRPTVRFFSTSDTYCGFKFLTEVTYIELTSWLKAGNYLKHNDQIINSRCPSSQIFALLRKGK